ncbi:MAG: hypothetical protein RR620_08245 [Clostridium sp.]
MCSGCIKAKLLKKDGSYEIVNESKLKDGDIVLVEEGDVVPGDGEIVDGVASVNEAAITGESVPVIKGVNERNKTVVRGTTVVSKYIKIKILLHVKHGILNKVCNLFGSRENKMCATK